MLFGIAVHALERIFWCDLCLFHFSFSNVYLCSSFFLSSNQILHVNSQKKNNTYTYTMNAIKNYIVVNVRFVWIIILIYVLTDVLALSVWDREHLSFIPCMRFPKKIIWKCTHLSQRYVRIVSLHSVQYAIRTAS